MVNVIIKMTNGGYDLTKGKTVHCIMTSKIAE